MQLTNHEGSSAETNDRLEILRRAIRAVATAQTLEEKASAAQSRRKTEAEWTSGEFARYGVPAASGTTDEFDTHPGSAPDSQPVLEEARDAMRAALVTYVRELRDSGAPPERAVVQLKVVLSEVLRAGKSSRGYTQLFDEALQWGIEAYYTRA